MRIRAMAIVAVVLSLAPIGASAREWPPPAPTRPAPPDERVFYVWYQFPGQRWSAIGPMSRYDATNLEADYRRMGARTAIVDHP
jgi:hypothetical protein